MFLYITKLLQMLAVGGINPP